MMDSRIRIQTLVILCPFSSFTSGFVAEDIMAIDKSFVDTVAVGGIVSAELQL